MSENLYEEIRMGEAVDKFRSTDVGVYLSRRAELDRYDALEQLAEADPSDVATVTRLQWQAKTPDLYLRWIADAIAAGELARYELETNTGE